MALLMAQRGDDDDADTSAPKPDRALRSNTPKAVAPSSLTPRLQSGVYSRTPSLVVSSSQRQSMLGSLNGSKAPSLLVAVPEGVEREETAKASQIKKGLGQQGKRSASSSQRTTDSKKLIPDQWQQQIGDLADESHVVKTTYLEHQCVLSFDL
jgi:hypothetical protein